MRVQLRNTLKVMTIVIMVLTSPVQAQLMLGNTKMVRMEAPLLRYPLHLPRMIDTVSVMPQITHSNQHLSGLLYTQLFLSQVGGVAFERLALPDSAIPIAAIKCNYDPDRPDGQRFSLHVNGRKIRTAIFDWLLIPIVHYADSPYRACFTYFGHLSDSEKEDEFQSKSGKIVNYHPAFDNTLIGLRLMQADLLLMNNDCADLPKLNGKYILGAGESEPDVYENSIGFNNTLLRLRSIENDLQYRYRSYLISDYNQNIRFTVRKDSLTISGNPFYYCWRYRFDTMSPVEQKGFQEQVLNNIDAQVEEMLVQYPDGEYSKRAWSIDQLLIQLKLYENRYNLYSAGTVIDCLAHDGDGARSDYLSRFTTASLKSMLSNLRYTMEMHEPQFLKEYSTRLSADQKLLRSMNPAVWDATEATLRYSAFFRYLKQEYPGEWSHFVNSIADVRIIPEIETPTVMWPGSPE